MYLLGEGDRIRKLLDIVVRQFRIAFRAGYVIPHFALMVVSDRVLQTCDAN
jgi:hypothetical protein